MYFPSQVTPSLCYDTSRCLCFLFSSSHPSHWQSAVVSLGCLCTNLFLITFLQVNILLVMAQKKKPESYRMESDKKTGLPPSLKHYLAFLV